MKKKLGFILFVVGVVLVTCTACGMKKSSTAASIQKNDIDETILDMEQEFGFADESIQGTYTSTRYYEGNTTKFNSTQIINEGFNDGVVYYKLMDEDSEEKKLLFVDINNEDGRIKLEAELRQNYDEELNLAYQTSRIQLATPHMKNRCYVTIKGDYLIVVTQEEKSDGIYDGYNYLAYNLDMDNLTITDGLEYIEKVAIYSMADGLEEVLKIQRRIDPRYTPATEVCEISYGDTDWVYAYGNITIINDSATFVTTEQEFCDKANQLLEEFSVDFIQFTRTSWENRWFRMEVDEKLIPEEMTKVDFSCSYGVINEEDTVTSDIEIRLNAPKEEHGKLQEELPDIPVDYNSTTSSEEKNDVVMPSYIPNSVDATALQDLRYFNLDGYWYSSDLRYVFRIYSNTPDNGFNTFSYVDFEGSEEHQFGTLNQTSSYSLILNARESRAKDFEVFAVEDQLKSDEITLFRVDHQLASRIVGNWRAENIEYLFAQDGTYKYKRSGTSDWGHYYIINETTMALGEAGEDLEIITYSIEGNTLVLDGGYVLTR